MYNLHILQIFIIVGRGTSNSYYSTRMALYIIRLCFGYLGARADPSDSVTRRQFYPQSTRPTTTTTSTTGAALLLSIQTDELVPHIVIENVSIGQFFCVYLL